MHRLAGARGARASQRPRFVLPGGSAAALPDCATLALQTTNQLFFLATELVPVAQAYALLDAAAPRGTPPRALLVLALGVPAAHIGLALKEGLLRGLLPGSRDTTNGRDVMLLAGDVACAALFARLLVARSHSRREAGRLLACAAACAAGLAAVYLLFFSYSL